MYLNWLYYPRADYIPETGKWLAIIDAKDAQTGQPCACYTGRQWASKRRALQEAREWLDLSGEARPAKEVAA